VKYATCLTEIQCGLVIYEFNFIFSLLITFIYFLLIKKIIYIYFKFYFGPFTVVMERKFYGGNGEKICHLKKEIENESLSRNESF
jgi:hypothetical protein